MSVAVQSAIAIRNSSGTTLSKAFTSANTGGNTIIVIAIWEDITHTMTVADSNGNTYTSLHGPDTLSSGFSAQVWKADSINAGANTVTITASGAVFDVLCILEYSQSFSGFDQFAKAQGTGTALASGSVTTTQANEVILAFGTNNFGGASFTAGTGFAIEQQVTGTATQDAYVEDQLVSATGSFNGTATQSVSTTWGAYILTLKIGSAPPPATAPPVVCIMQ